MIDRLVRRSVTLDASVDEVWRLLTDTEELAGWLGEVDGDRITELDGTVRRFVFDDVVEGQRVGFTWWQDDPAARWEQHGLRGHLHRRRDRGRHPGDGGGAGCAGRRQALRVGLVGRTAAGARDDRAVAVAPLDPILVCPSHPR